MAKATNLIIKPDNPLYAKFLELERQEKLEKFSSNPQIKMLMDLQASAKSAIEKYETERKRLADVVKENEGASDLLPFHLSNSGVSIEGGLRSRASAAEMGARWAGISGALNGNPKPVPSGLKKRIMDAESNADLAALKNDRHAAGVYTLQEIVELSGYDKKIVTGLLTHKDYKKHFEVVRQGTKRGVISPVWHFKTVEK